MITVKSFEELWEKSESLYKNDPSTTSSIVQEIIAKLMLYRALHENTGLDEKQKQEAKYHLMGKVLSCMTHLSQKDNINTFAALLEITKELQIEKLESVVSSKS